MSNTTVDVIIDTDEKFPEYEIVMYDSIKNLKTVCGYPVKRRTVTKLPLKLYKKFIQAQKTYNDIETEMVIWIEKHPNAKRVEYYD